MPPNARSFTADAVGMYTNIDTDPALQDIKDYFFEHRQQYSHLPLQSIHRALELIMKYNIFKFGDGFWKQEKSAAMGAPPVPPYATISFGIHKASGYSYPMPEKTPRNGTLLNTS
eukprot:4162045-Ditylum_brightwellii.AAC.1